MVTPRRWFSPLCLLLLVLIAAGRATAVQLGSSEQIGLRSAVERVQVETAVLPTLPPVLPGTSGQQVGVVLPTGLNVRLGAGNDFGVITAVKQGTELELLGQDRSGAWLKVALPTGEKGWVGAAFVARSAATVALPVVVGDTVLTTATATKEVVVVTETAVSSPTATLTQTAAATVTVPATATRQPIIIATAQSVKMATPTESPTAVPTDTPVPTSTATTEPTSTVAAAETNVGVEETAVVPPTATDTVALAQAGLPTIEPSPEPLATLAIRQASPFTPPVDTFPISKVIGTVFLVVSFFFAIIIFIRVNRQRI